MPNRCGNDERARLRLRRKTQGIGWVTDAAVDPGHDNALMDEARIPGKPA